MSTTYEVKGLVLERYHENGCNDWRTVNDYFCKEFDNLSDAKACFIELATELEDDFYGEGNTSTCGFYGLRDRGNAVEFWEMPENGFAEIIGYKSYTYDDWKAAQAEEEEE